MLQPLGLLRDHPPPSQHVCLRPSHGRLLRNRRGQYLLPFSITLNLPIALASPADQQDRSGIIYSRSEQLQHVSPLDALGNSRRNQEKEEEGDGRGEPQ